VELIELNEQERAVLREAAAELAYRVSATDDDDLRLAWVAGVLRGIAARPPALRSAAELAQR
jgi:hypothetical protein